MIDDASAGRLAAVALGHVTREYPHLISHVLSDADDVAPPRVLHPIFHGSFDWHSCVHGYWLLASLLRRHPAHPHAAATTTLFDARLKAEAVAGECAYFHRPGTRGFERPYGWAWLLALHHALRGTPWQPTLGPLADVIAARFRAYLPQATYPVRVGTHFNSAFALTLAAPWAAAHDPALLALLRDKATGWYAGDAACQAWEPSQDDFLSSALTEAVCMHRLHAGGFDTWFTRFLPGVAHGHPATLFRPATVTDRTDGKIAHLDGLNLSRAWCWSVLAAAMPPGPARDAAIDTAAAHRQAGLAHVSGDYMGEHWLASFALLALDPAVLD